MMAAQSGGHHCGPLLHKFTFSQSIRTLYIVTSSLSPASSCNLEASAAPPSFYEALLLFIIRLQVMHTMILLGLFQQLKLLFYFTNRKPPGPLLFLLHLKHPHVFLCTNVKKLVDTCSKISANHSHWHHKITTWMREAFRDLCLIQRCASPPFLWGALPEWTICGFAKEKKSNQTKSYLQFKIHLNLKEFLSSVLCCWDVRRAWLMFSK